VQFKPIERDAYDLAVAEVDAGRFDLRIRPVEFSLDAFLADPIGYPKTLQEALA
jgi:urea carboxylase